jgi:integrase/recombinase XerD
VQRIVNPKNDRPSAQRNLLKTLHAMFKWALAEDRVPGNPTLGVTRQKIKSAGYRTWSEGDIAQYRRRHLLGTKARLALELALSTAGRRKEIVWLGPQHVEDGIVSFEQSKTEGTDDAPVSIPLDPSFFEALAAMPSSKIVTLSAIPTFLTTDKGRPFASPASFGNWFRKRCDEAGLPKGLSLHGFRNATARRLAERGCSVHEIAAITGHASVSAKSKDTQRPPTRSDLQCRPKRSCWRTERKHYFTNLRDRFVALHAKSLKMREHKMRMVGPGGRAHRRNV